jgi:HEAT repeat protein
MVNPPSVHELLADLKQPDPGAPDKQWQAAQALGREKESGGKAVEALMEALGPTYGALARAHAAESLGNLGDGRAVPALMAALGDPYRLTRSYAARALGKLGDVQAIGKLLKTMESDEFFGVRAEAAEALGKLCEGKDMEQCRKVRRALLAQKKVEQERQKHGAEEGRGVRVLGEVDRSLRRLGELVEQAETQVKEIQSAVGRNDLQAVNRSAGELRSIMHEFRTVMLNFAT